jgi:hypothetical protein
MNRARPERGEDGFVLIAAIWLLILAGSITAILMLRSLAAATAAADHQQSLERRLALESAVETMLADRLFEGNRSAWNTTPAAASIAVGKYRVDLKVTSESGRLDVNSADPALIDTALQGFGIGSAERNRIVARLTALRLAKRSIGSLPELSALLGESRVKNGSCLADSLTWVSGLAEPRPEQAPPALARALGRAGGASGPSAPEPGSALRIEASVPGSAPILALVRTTGLPAQPTSITLWGAATPCS